MQASRSPCTRAFFVATRLHCCRPATPHSQATTSFPAQLRHVASEFRPRTEETLGGVFIHLQARRDARWEAQGRPLQAKRQSVNLHDVRTFPLEKNRTDWHPRNHLAPISGSIEPEDPSPLAAAWREIAEETSLDHSSLTFLRSGKSHTFADPSVGREWTVYPFAFALKSPTSETESRIAIDWEHTSWAWHAPSSITDDPSFHGVPRLAESLRRVWFENDLGPSAGAILSSGLHSLATDNVSGARQMASSALRILRETILAFRPCAPTEAWWSAVRMAAWHLVKSGRESMSAAIQSALLAALCDIERYMATHPRDEEF